MSQQHAMEQRDAAAQEAADRAIADRHAPLPPLKADWRVLKYMQVSDRMFHARLARAWMLADDGEQQRLMQAFGREYREYHDRFFYPPSPGTEPDADASGPASTPDDGGLLKED